MQVAMYVSDALFSEIHNYIKLRLGTFKTMYIDSRAGARAWHTRYVPWASRFWGFHEFYN